MPAEYECERVTVDGVDIPLASDATVVVGLPPETGERWRVEAAVSNTMIPPRLVELSGGTRVARVVCTSLLRRPTERVPAKRIAGEATVLLEPSGDSEAYMRLAGEQSPRIEW